MNLPEKQFSDKRFMFEKKIDVVKQISWKKSVTYKYYMKKFPKAKRPCTDILFSGSKCSRN